MGCHKFALMINEMLKIPFDGLADVFKLLFDQFPIAAYVVIANQGDFVSGPLSGCPIVLVDIPAAPLA